MSEDYQSKRETLSFDADAIRKGRQTGAYNRDCLRQSAEGVARRIRNASKSVEETEKSE